MGKIKGWEKTGTMSWSSEKDNYHCYVVHEYGKLDTKNQYTDLDGYRGILERRGRLIDQSMSFGNKEAAKRWCTSTMKRMG